MDHFEVLKKVIDDQQGALIKTIGDAVMAAFRRPVNALRAVLKAQILLQSAQLGRKAGLHSGPCIAVTLNERLDYFGSSVNIAARLVDLSDGSDVVISQVIRDDPEVAAMLADPKADLQSQPLQSTLKGFGDDRFSLWQMKSAQVASEDHRKR